MSEKVTTTQSGTPSSLTRPSFTGGKYDSRMLGDAIPVLVHESLSSSQSLQSGEAPWQLLASEDLPPSWKREPSEIEAVLPVEDPTVLSSGENIVSSLEFVDTNPSEIYGGELIAPQASLTSGALPSVDISGTLASGTISITQMNIPPTQTVTAAANAGSNTVSMDQTTSLLGASRPKFVEKPENWLCCHCKDILIEPMQTQCGHLMCKACIDFLLSTLGDPVTCPLSTEDDPCDPISKQDAASVSWITLKFIHTSTACSKCI